MQFWRSVVGKLWATILLLVSCVLVVLTMLLLKFFETYHVQEAEKELTQLAVKVAEVMHERQDEALARSIASSLVGDASKAIIVLDNTHYWYLPSHAEQQDVPFSFIEADDELKQAFTKQVKKKMHLPNMQTTDGSSQWLVVGVPLQTADGKRGAVFVFQSLQAVEDTTKQTTKFIFLAAFIAIVLTTIFAFFLSTRITAPLRKMRQAAFEVARGKFDTKVPILTHDEIGELAMAFNQMGRRLQFNMNALNQEKE
ncbi:MAG: HAMP domain-containing protein, partial [Anoxybacillus sp.]